MFFDYDHDNPKRSIPVLHLITRLIVGGAQENTMYTADLLDKNKFNVSIISGQQTGSEGSLIEEVIKRGIKLSIFPELVREINPIKDTFALVKLIIHLKAEKPQIIHTHSSKAGILGRLAAKIAGIPIIIHTVHGWSFHDQMPVITKIIYIILERLSAIFSDALICVSERDIEKGLSSHIGEKNKYSLIRSAIPLEEFQKSSSNRLKIRKELGIPEQSTVIGNIGRFSEQKNPLDWIKIAAKIANQDPDCRFLMVGDGPLRQKVLSLCHDLMIQDRLVLPGLRRNVPELFSAIDVFLLTSLWEGLPRVIPQAMSMEIPVIAYQIDGIDEVIIHGETGYLVKPGMISEAANYCIQLINNPSIRLAMGSKGKKHIDKDFDISLMIHDIENLYIELLTQNKKNYE